MRINGSMTARVLFVSDFQRVNCAAEGKPLGEGLFRLLQLSCIQAGLREADYAVAVLHERTPRGGKEVYKLPVAEREADLASFKQLLSEHSANVIVPLGEYAMQMLTGISGIGNYHCNVMRLRADLGGRKCIPLLHPEFVNRSCGDSAYIVFGCHRIHDQAETAELSEVQRTFRLSPSFAESMKLLASLETADTLAVDIETGSGLINTVGFATSATEAIALRTLPEFYSEDEFLQLWQAIAKVLEGPSKKVLQNFIYEATWFARYGIEMANTVFDTMWAMKFLHPEFDKGLDNVGRIYTPFLYWKSDNDDWSQVRDWNRHLRYNCCDTTGTFAAYETQTETLRERGLSDLFHGYIMRFAPVIQEMCCTGLLVDEPQLQRLQERLLRDQESSMRILQQEFQARLQREVNPRSPKQLQAALRELGIKLPTKYSKSKGEQSETTDKKALVKLRKKYPKEPVLPALIGLSATNKQLSSYASFDYDRISKRVHYTLDGCGTETGRWAGYNSGWGEGFNPQTVPKSVRSCFHADAGRVLVQIDLSQAESRYVAWESPEPTLMQMLQEGRDIHKYVAGRIFKKPEEIVNTQERNLGKKSGHASNYSVGPRTFAESCLVDMNLHIEESEARRILATYFEVFPGIRTRQANIRKEVQQKRMLRTPIGRERHFYGRMDDATYREAYAYAPQSVIPDITNHLMLKLWEERDYIGLERDNGGYFLLQVHDSLLLQTTPDRVADIAALAKDLPAWHPRIQLPGGDLWIPVEVEVGDNWKAMVKV